MLYSDGITDHMNAAGHGIRPRPPGADRCGRTCDISADALILEIFKELDKFSTVAFDDQSVFVMKVK